MEQEGILLNAASNTGATPLWIACQVNMKNNLFHIFKFDYYGEIFIVSISFFDKQLIHTYSSASPSVIRIILLHVMLIWKISYFQYLNLITLGRSLLIQFIKYLSLVYNLFINFILNRCSHLLNHFSVFN